MNDVKANIKRMIKYVVTNPDKETKLHEDDLVFVLARHYPGDPDLWDEFDQRNNDMFDAQQHKLIQNINTMMLKSSSRPAISKAATKDNGQSGPLMGGSGNQQQHASS